MRAAIVSAMVTGALAAPLHRLSATCNSEARCETAGWTEKGWMARAAFRPGQNETGWATLFVETAAGAPDEAAAYSAGYLEGLLTADMIYNAWLSKCATQEPSAKAKVFLHQQISWMEQQVAAAAGSSDSKAQYWKSVGLSLQQFNGLVAGYKAAADVTPLSFDQLLCTALNIEINDVEQAVDKSARPDYSKLNKKQFWDMIIGNSHCTAMFRVTPDLGDLIAAHTSWTYYSWMLRIYKAYTFRFSTSKAETLMFSGYPASLSSIDDFVMTSQKLVIIETTNGIFNTSLYDYVQPQSVPYWIRVLVASRHATSTKEWHDLFYLHNSGTYNCQWMVADYKKFVPHTPLPAWTFAVSEQTPGPYSHLGEDMTDVLQRDHWPSYNVAYFKDVYDISGYPEIVKKQGLESSYQLAPRAPIFRRDAGQVVALEHMKRFIRENNYGHDDPLAKDPCSAIACRGDLGPDPGAFGAIDAKITNKQMLDAMTAWAIAGPTTERQPAFSYTGRWADSTHPGQPTTFDFDWQLMSLGSFGAEEEKPQILMM